MKFTPKPPNDFRDFFSLYFERCRTQCPKILAIAGKWIFEDLIPGLSDFDTRFILTDTVTIDEWHQYSILVGQVHTELAIEFPHWARNLEHLPGLNLAIGEITSPLQYYPEFKQWTFYAGDCEAIRHIESSLGARHWSPRDEIYHLKKVAAFFGPYIRGIDPPINMGPWENKYALHSRYMHYFTPAIQAMVSLKSKHTVRGKFDALRQAHRLFPNPETIELILNTLEQHYEVEADYREPRLTEIEQDLERYLNDAWGTLINDVTLLHAESGDSRQDINAKVSGVPVDPAEVFFEGVKFSRFMKGRLLFYASQIAWFDSIWLIQNELGRIVTNFHDKPLKTFGQLRYGEDLEPHQVLDRIRGDILTNEDCDGLADFSRLASLPIPKGREKQHAQTVADVYDPVLSSLEKLSAEMITINSNGIDQT